MYSARLLASKNRMEKPETFFRRLIGPPVLNRTIDTVPENEAVTACYLVALAHRHKENIPCNHDVIPVNRLFNLFYSANLAAF